MGGSLLIEQNEETKKHVPKGRTGENSRKRPKQNGQEQSTRYRVQDTGYRTFNELRGRVDGFSENFNEEIVNITKDTETIKKIPLRSKKYNN